MKDHHKFRFYDSGTKLMCGAISFDYSSDTVLVNFGFHPEMPDDELTLSLGHLMQCTGIKDSKGVLIYEGDVVSVGERNIQAVAPYMALYLNLIEQGLGEIQGHIYDGINYE